MPTLLTICIPTYKRSTTLRRCIDSLVEQIEKFELSDAVNIFVADDASPDDTQDVLQSYEALNYFTFVTREQNLGMNVNIKCMLSEIAQKSHYQLIITDDDFLQPDILREIVEFLRVKQNDGQNVPAIWTPRYSYTEDGNLHCIVCNPFKSSSFVKSSIYNTGKYMHNGFVLSGLIIRAKYIDYKSWEQYKRNAYFPMLFFGDLLFRHGAYYWDKNIVHHTVLNICHWERWGKNDVVISLRKFSDYLNCYSVMAKNICKNSLCLLFYFSSFRQIYKRVNVELFSETLKGNKKNISDAVLELKTQGFLKFKFLLSVIMICALILNIFSSVFISIIASILIIFSPRREKKKHYRKIMQRHLRIPRIAIKLFGVII